MPEQVTGKSKDLQHSPLSLSLTLPLPPSINEQYATVNGHRISSKVAHHFKKQVLTVLHALERKGMLDDTLRNHFRQNYLALFLDFYFATPLKRDLDGGLKITQDALCEGLGVNDNRIVDIHLVKHIDPLHPHLFVELEVIADWHFDKEYVLLS